MSACDKFEPEASGFGACDTFERVASGFSRKGDAGALFRLEAEATKSLAFTRS